MTIQSPFEWGWDRLRGGVQATGSATREEYWAEAHHAGACPPSAASARPISRRRCRGASTISAPKRTDVIFLCVI